VRGPSGSNQWELDRAQPTLRARAATIVVNLQPTKFDELNTVPEEETATSRIERWIRSGATVIAPATLLSALLFYFGYVSARSQYEYFGVDVDTIGLGTQDYVMRSPQPLLTPLLVFAFVGIGALAVHAAVRKRIGPADKQTSATQATRICRFGKSSRAIGLATLIVGVGLLGAYALLRDWPFYGLVTPLLIAVGGALFLYGSHLLKLLRRKDQPPPNAPSSTLLHRASAGLIYAVIAISVFWMTATVAQWSGRGTAMYQARHLDLLPSVILDTKESLLLRSPGVLETTLQPSAGQTFHYRYRNLRLLIHGRDRMFLVPDTWSANNSTMAVALDGSVRVQFQFQNQRP
jgi:hypothetical protein